MCPAFQTPTPAIGKLFDALQAVSAGQREVSGVAVDQPHDALAVADQIAQPPSPKDRLTGRFVTRPLMDLGQIATQRFGTLQVDTAQFAAVAQPEEIVSVELSGLKFCDEQQLPWLAQ